MRFTFLRNCQTLGISRLSRRINKKFGKVLSGHTATGNPPRQSCRILGAWMAWPYPLRHPEGGQKPLLSPAPYARRWRTFRCWCGSLSEKTARLKNPPTAAIAIFRVHASYLHPCIQLVIFHSYDTYGVDGKAPAQETAFRLQTMRPPHPLFLAGSRRHSRTPQS